MRTAGRPSAPAPLRPDRRSEVMRPHSLRPTRANRLRFAAVLVGASALVLTSCSLPSSGDAPAAPTDAAAAPAPAPSLTWSAAEGSTIKPGEELRVRVADGTLQAFGVVDQDGKALTASTAANSGAVVDLPPERTLTPPRSPCRPMAR